MRLFGITSWGLNCADGVGIYARVGFYQDWINKTINAKEAPKKDDSYETPTLASYEADSDYDDSYYDATTTEAYGQLMDYGDLGIYGG